MNSNTFTCIGKGHGSPAIPATLEQWLQLRQAPWLKDMCQRIENGEEGLKSRLPIWTPSCAEFRENHRAVKDALQPLPRLMLDFDQKGHSQEILERCMQLKQLGKWDILLVEESVRKGTHVLITLPEGMTPQQAQERFSADVGFQADPALKDVARCIYMVPEDRTLYIAEDIDKATALPPVQESEEPRLQGAYKTSVRKIEKKPLECLTSSSTLPFTMEQLTDIAEELSHIVAGGAPQEGMRNELTYEVAKKMRHLTGDDAALLAQVIPQWEESPEKHLQAIENALRYGKRLAYIPKDLQRAMDYAQVGGGNEAEEDEMTPPPLPTHLPQSMETILQSTPENARPAVAMSVFSALRALMHKVKFQMMDNTQKEPCFLHVCAAPHGSGKTALRPPQKAILHKVAEQDALTRQEENKWREECATLPANKEKPKRPKGAIRLVQADMTSPALVTLCARAEGHSLYTYGEELDKLMRLRGASEIIRTAYDTEEYGQERVGPASVSDVVTLRWNFCYSTTPGMLLKIMAGDVLNGTLSRLNLSTILINEDDWGEETPVYGDYGEDYSRSIEPYLQHLEQCRGTIRCEEALQWAQQEKLRQIDRLKMMDAKYMQPFLWRSLEMAFWRASMLYIMHGGEWSEEIAEFASWTVEYDLWCKMHFFGHLIEASTQEQTQHHYRPTSLLAQLPAQFTRDDARIMRRRLGKDTSSRALRNMLNTWLHRGFVRLDKERDVYIKNKREMQTNMIVT